MPEVAIARVEVRAEAMKRMLDHLTEVAVPLGVRVEVQGDALKFSFHDPEQSWWATTQCRGSALPGTSASDSASVTVPRLLMREAVEFAQLDPVAQCTVAVHDAESVHVGGAAVAASQAWPEISAPPSIAGRPCADAALAVPAGPWETEQKVQFVVDGVHLTVASGLLARFRARGIDRVSLYLGEDPVLVGESDDADPDDRLVLIVPAQANP